MACPFCNPGPTAIKLSNQLSYAREDGFPVSPGHLLIIPLRHVSDFFDLTEEERTAMFELLWVAKKHLSEALKPGGFNVGVNAGEVAGQTVMHVHLHLIPRYAGDVPDPRGGVRWVIPEKGRYW